MYVRVYIDVCMYRHICICIFEYRCVWLRICVVLFTGVCFMHIGPSASFTARVNGSGLLCFDIRIVHGTPCRGAGICRLLFGKTSWSCGSGLQIAMILWEGPTGGTGGVEISNQCFMLCWEAADMRQTPSAAAKAVQTGAWLIDCDWRSQDGIFQQNGGVLFWGPCIRDLILSGLY